MSGDAHRVRRLLWRIRLESPEEAFALRARLTRTVRTAILPEIERTFADLPSSDDLIHIERLEVTVRVADTDSLERATVDAIRTGLQARLASLAATPPGAMGSAPDTRVRRATVRVSRLASLLHYLETGAVPWYAEPASADLAYVRELEETAVSDMTAVLQHFPGAPPAAAVFMFRLLSLLPDAGWVSVVHAVARQRHRSEEPEVAEAIERIATAPERSSARHARLELAAAIIAGWFATGEASPAATEKPTVSSDAQRLFDRLALPPRLARPINSPRFSFAIPGNDSIGSGMSGEAHPAASRPDQDRTFGVPVSYAGLVLLAPFLPRLFAARNVLHPGEKSLQAEALRRAAALLHFAAAADHDGHEYELGLIKILLGVPIDQPILFASGILSRGDREAVETLLSDVVEHWRVIRPISIDALRESFLHRRGLLSEHRGSWHLRIEGAPIDSFLDHLPWSLTTLTMAWLPSPITIDWPR